MKKILPACKLTLLLTALLLVSALGCRRQNPETVIAPPPLQQANLLVDQGRYAEVVHILEGELLRQPQNSEVRLALSTTYLAMAGIDSHVYFELSRVYMDYKAPDLEQFLKGYENILKQIRPEGPNSRSAAQIIRQYLSLAQSIEVFLRLFDSLPPISKEQLPWAIKALEVVQAPFPPAPRGPYFYRALLRLILFKHKWQHGYYFAHNVSCKQYAAVLDTGLEQLQQDFARIREDLVLASQESLPQITQVEDYIKTLVSLIRQGLGSAQNGAAFDYENQELAEALFAALATDENLNLLGVEPCLSLP